MEDIPKCIHCNDAEFEINYVQQQKNGAVNFSLLTQLCLSIDIRPCFHGQAYNE